MVFAGHHLVSTYSFDADWPTWEIHPAGDEIVCLLSGEARLILDHGDRHEQIALDEPLAYAIVPARDVAYCAYEDRLHDVVHYTG